jgi:hypothetical protein
VIERMDHPVKGVYRLTVTDPVPAPSTIIGVTVTVDTFDVPARNALVLSDFKQQADGTSRELYRVETQTGDRITQRGAIDDGERLTVDVQKWLEGMDDRKMGFHIVKGIHDKGDIDRAWVDVTTT